MLLDKEPDRSLLCSTAGRHSPSPNSSYGIVSGTRCHSKCRVVLYGLCGIPSAEMQRPSWHLSTSAWAKYDPMACAGPIPYSRSRTGLLASWKGAEVVAIACPSLTIRAAGFRKGRAQLLNSYLGRLLMMKFPSVVSDQIGHNLLLGLLFQRTPPHMLCSGQELTGTILPPNY